MATRTKVEEPDGTTWHNREDSTWGFACAHCAHVVTVHDGGLGDVWSRGVDHLRYTHAIIRSYVPRLDTQSNTAVQQAFDILFARQTEYQARALRGPRPNGE